LFISTNLILSGDLSSTTRSFQSLSSDFPTTAPHRCLIRTGADEHHSVAIRCFTRYFTWTIQSEYFF